MHARITCFYERCQFNSLKKFGKTLSLFDYPFFLLFKKNYLHVLMTQTNKLVEKKKKKSSILDHMNIWASSSDKIWSSTFPMGRVCIRCMQYTHEKNIFSGTQTLCTWEGGRELKGLASEKERKKADFYVSNGKELNFGHNTKRKSEGKHEYVLTKSQVFKKML